MSEVRDIHGTPLDLENVSAFLIRDWGWIEVRPGTVIAEEENDLIFFLDAYGRLNGFDSEAVLGSRWDNG
ncbi:hypothetical protein [Streptosporangium sp. OZ121]|uniref:hypothetical protein n=1 Tax=Streptosporangium sp. OZ121 TaxID=3444183 RepID=UPI003F7AE408